MTIWKDKNE